jgi:protein FRA10AC1
MSARQPHPPSEKLKNVVSEADHEILKEHYTFVPPEEAKATLWQERMVQRYHDGLYKEFALADLSRPGQIGLRWRTQQEVLDGRGERTCGNKRCPHQDQQRTNSDDDLNNLSTLEVPFSYCEHGIAKKELVKLRLCQSCRPLVDTKKQMEENRTEKTRLSTGPSKVPKRARDDNYNSGSSSLDIDGLKLETIKRREKSDIELSSESSDSIESATKRRRKDSRMKYEKGVKNRSEKPEMPEKKKHRTKHDGRTKSKRR